MKSLQYTTIYLQENLLVAGVTDTQPVILIGSTLFLEGATTLSQIHVA